MRFIGFYDYTVVLTYMSLFFAVVGMTRALQGDFKLAVLCLFLCGFCDAFDGTVARTKKDRTVDGKNFGIQLDSLCDVICFGFYPAFLCYLMGVDGILGIILVFGYTLCALIRLAFFNMLEGKREGEGVAKYYRGLPVTMIAGILPLVYVTCRGLTSFVMILHVMLGIVAFLFILDFPVPKIDFGKYLHVK